MSLDGKRLLYMRGDARQGANIYVMPLDGDRKPVPFLTEKASETEPNLSPDGSMLAYVSDESGRREIYLKPFPTGEGRWQVSSAGGRAPRWNKAGNSLFYVQGSTLMETSVTTRPVVLLGTPRELFNGEKDRVLFEHRYDVSPDARRFVVVKEAESEKNKVRTITVVRNWFAEFKGKAKQ